MVIDRVISEYLQDKGRRIIIPGFGAFIRRDEGELAFLAILKNDDGVLASEVSKRLNYSEAEAAETVRKYAETLKSELAAGRSVTIKGVGTVMPGEGKKLVFETEGDYREDIAAVMAENADKVVGNPELSEKALAAAHAQQGKAAVQAKWDKEAGKGATQEQQAKAPEKVTPQPQPQAKAQTRPDQGKSGKEEGVITAGNSTENNKNTGLEILSGADIKRQAPPTPREQPAEKEVQPPARPETKPHIQGQRPIVVSSPQQSKPAATGYNLNIRRPAKRKKMDTVLIIAIIAILCALGVLLYGYIVGQGYNINLDDMLGHGLPGAGTLLT